MEDIHAHLLSLLEELGDLEIRVLVMLHKGDESLYTVFLPEPLEIGLEIPLPPTVCLIRLLAGGKGQPKLPRQLQRLPGQEVHANRVGFGGFLFFSAHSLLPLAIDRLKKVVQVIIYQPTIVAS